MEVGLGSLTHLTQISFADFTFFSATLGGPEASTDRDAENFSIPATTVVRPNETLSLIDILFGINARVIPQVT